MDAKTEQHGNVEIGIVTHEGKDYAALGSVTDDPLYLVAYLAKDRKLTKWDGTVIGHYNIVATWLTPRSFVSSTMNQVEAWIGPRCYTGRSAGVGMIFKGKRVARQRNMA